MSLSTTDQGYACQIGHYADAIVVPSGYEQIIVSGTPGLNKDGVFAGAARAFDSYETAMQVFEEDSIEA